MRVVLMSFALSLTACATLQSAKTDEGPTPVVAKYGDKVLRLSEVDAKAGEDLTKLQEQIYDVRTEAAEQLAIESLVAKKALAAGMSDDEWLAKNVESLIPDPSETEMRALFEKVRERLPPQVGFDDVRPQLKAVIQKELRAKKAREVFGALKKEAGFTMVLPGPEKKRKTVDATGPSRGGKTAKVTIVEFADFECPYCARAHETVMAVLRAYGDKVRIVFRHYPLSFHPKAPKAAEATACADEQGKFWEMHDALFESQELDEEALKLQAKQVGVDEAKFATCLSSGRTMPLVKRDMAAGQQAGVNGTPAFFINGFMISGAQPEEAFRKIIDAELARLGE